MMGCEDGEVGGTNLGQRLVADFGISIIETSGSATAVLDSNNEILFVF
jgi:hypothetical protein